MRLGSRWNRPWQLETDRYHPPWLAVALRRRWNGVLDAGLVVLAGNSSNGPPQLPA